MDDQCGCKTQRDIGECHQGQRTDLSSAADDLGSPMASCQASIGTLLVTMVAFRPWRYSRILSRSLRSTDASGARPESSRMSRLRSFTPRRGCTTSQCRQAGVCGGSGRHGPAENSPAAHCSRCLVRDVDARRCSGAGVNAGVMFFRRPLPCADLPRMHAILLGQFCQRHLLTDRFKRNLGVGLGRMVHSLLHSGSFLSSCDPP